MLGKKQAKATPSNSKASLFSEAVPSRVRPVSSLFFALESSTLTSSCTPLLYFIVIYFTFRNVGHIIQILFPITLFPLFPLSKYQRIWFYNDNLPGSQSGN